MTTTKDHQPVVQHSLALYFRERVHQCAQALKPTPREETCWYVSSLLERFGRSESCFSFEQGQWTLRPLALLYKDALDAQSERERCLILQHLGDLALFLGGLFPEHFTRRGIASDYLVSMGGGAYDYLSDNARVGRGIFGELSASFRPMMQVVANACASGGGSKDDYARVGQSVAETDGSTTSAMIDESGGMTAAGPGPTELYRRWLANGDPQLLEQLRALGLDVDLLLEGSDALH